MLIERYTRIVLSQPGSPFPLQRLAQLYRDKDGNIANLVKDFEGRAAQSGPDQYAATATLAGIYKLDGRGDDAVNLPAIALKATDPPPFSPSPPPPRPRRHGRRADAVRAGARAGDRRAGARADHPAR
ncbi:MAG: hypothetical protein IPQ09_15240 [Myxococcales bacterium]|nr:hypothetical protein [Myxococcales bacterium]